MSPFWCWDASWTCLPPVSLRRMLACFGYHQNLPFDKTPLEFLTKNKNDYELIRSYLGKIKLESLAHNKLIGELSGGQKARVAIIKLIAKGSNTKIKSKMKIYLRLMSVLLDFSSLPCKLISRIFFLCDSAPIQFQ
jgi:hypothetical protein